MTNSNFHPNLTGKRALITGASSGIGRATAIALATVGVHLTLVSRNLEKLNVVAEEARSLGVEASVHSVDLAEVETVQAKIAAIVAAEPIDILINNAGMGYTGDLATMSLDVWQTLFDLNVTSVFQCVQGVLPTMRQRGGAIVNLVSVAGHQVFPGWVAYCTSKAALLALSKGIAAEERANGIRVTALCPGAVNTPIWDTDTMNVDFDRGAMLTPDLVAKTIVDVLMLPETAVIEELTLMPSAGVL